MNSKSGLSIMFHKNIEQDYVAFVLQSSFIKTHISLIKSQTKSLLGQLLLVSFVLLWNLSINCLTSTVKNKELCISVMRTFLYGEHGKERETW